MAIYSKFPYSNFNNLNLDWIIAKVKEYVDKTDKLEINFTDLKNYVMNYFDNLDVQQEINNKLQEMYDNGELATLIAQYLQTQSLLVFRNKYYLKNATNLIPNITVMIDGENLVMDGKTQLFYIRPLTSSDVIDDIHIVGLNNYPTLIAERFNILYDEPVVNYPSDLTGKNVLLIGDSFLAGQGATHGWGYYLDQKYSPANTYTYALSGAGFIHPNANSKTFTDALEQAHTDITDTVDYVIIVGGRNDYTHAYDNDATTKLQTFCTKLKTYYPNAKYYYFGNSGRNGTYRTTNYTYYAKDMYELIKNVMITNGVLSSLDLIWWTYHDDNLCATGDNVHLNDNGYTLYADLINQFINGSSIVYESESLPLVLDSTYVTNSTKGICYRKADIVYISYSFISLVSGITSSNVVATIPKKITPTYNQYATALFNNTPVALQFAYTDYSGTTDGELHIPAGTSSTTNLRVNTTYSVQG